MEASERGKGTGGVASLSVATSASSWLSFAVLAALAATAQVFVVRTGRSHGFHTAIVFVTAGALLLPPELIVLMVAIQHIPEWIKERYPAYIQTFNIFNFALAALAAWGVAQLSAPITLGANDTRAAGAAIAACLAFVLVNHALLAPMLRLARGVSFADSGLFSLESLSSDVVPPSPERRPLLLRRSGPRSTISPRS